MTDTPASDLPPINIVCPRGLNDPALLQRAIDAALADEALMASIGGVHGIKDIIYIEGRMLNFVTRS